MQSPQLSEYQRYFSQAQSGPSFREELLALLGQPLDIARSISDSSKKTHRDSAIKALWSNKSLEEE